MNIYLVHGLSAPHWIMRPLGKKLEKYGHKSYLLNYPSRRLNVSQAADHIWQKLESKIDPRNPIVIVTHSLGGLVIQQLLERYKPKGIHCLIMIGPPNHGVELVSRFERSIFTKWILYLVGALPTHTLGKQKNPIAPNVCDQYTCHLINGITSKTLSGMLIEGKNDGIVSQSSTTIKNLASVTTLPYEHLVLLFKKKTVETIIKMI